jgi:integrase
MTLPKQRDTKRRGRDEGSVYARADGRLVVQVSLGVVAGKRRKREVLMPRGATRKQALERLRELQVVHVGVTALPVSGRTLGDLLTEYVEHVRRTRAPSTWRNAEQSTRLVLVPHLGALPLADLRAPPIRDAFDRLRDVGTSAKRQAFEILNRALGYAVRRGVIDANPCAGVPRPRHRGRDMSVWSPEQIGQFLDRATDHPRFAAAVLAMTAGLRAGEIRGLRWDDLDVRARTLTVRRQHGRDGERAPKSSSSRRAVPLTGVALAALERHRARLVDLFDAPPAAMFPAPHGGPVSAPVLQRDWRAMVEMSGLPRRRLHEMRHSAGSLLIAEGVDARTVSEILGHSSPSVTLAIYTHSNARMHAAAASRIEEAVRSSSGLSRGTRPRSGTAQGRKAK